jgi:CRISPR-associated protein Cas2
MADEHLYIVTYDIADARRWRSVFKLMHGYGEWLQLSVFQCRLTRARSIDLRSRLLETIHHNEDHVMIVDVGLAEAIAPRIESIGKRAYRAVERLALVV